MSGHEIEAGSGDASRLLAGAFETVRKVRYCWLLTGAGDGGAGARPMGLVMNRVDAAGWRIAFLTDGRSRKASELRRDGRAAVVFQYDRLDSFVVLRGRPTLKTGAAEVRQRWKDAFNVYFPSETDRANAIFVEVDVDRVDLWIRGLTPEPFGLRATTLEREAGGDWRLA